MQRADQFPHVLAIDAGTTSVRCVAVAADSTVTTISQREFAQHYPQPGWVEHDADEIFDAVRACVLDVLDRLPGLGVDVGAVRGIGITNQRETVVAWSRATGRPLARAIVWQDRRTAARCDELRAEGAEDAIRTATGLVCDPYFSATKMQWLLRDGGVPADDDLCFGTIDSWLTFRLTGGEHVTDASNASRTMLFDLRSGDWSPELCARFDVPPGALPAVVDSSGVVGTTDPDVLGGHRIPVAGMAGDQQSSLFGQACFSTGMSKNTYGTGSFVLVNAGHEVPPVSAELLSTVAWRLDGVPTYALEGSIFVTGAAIKWLRDALGVIAESSETGPLAASVPDAGGVVVVPAFAGLGAPHWDPYARGAVFGLTRGTHRAHLVRAVVEAITFQVRDVCESVATVLGAPLTDLRVDGGAAVMDLLCQLQADQLGLTVQRPVSTETTALGAAYLAGIATGVWSSLDDVTASWTLGAEFTPTADRTAADTAFAAWRRAVDKTRAAAVRPEEA